MAPGECIYDPGGMADLKPGMHTYHFLLDPENHVRETDESNNVLEGTFEVLPAGHPDVGTIVTEDALHNWAKAKRTPPVWPSSTDPFSDWIRH